MLIQLILSHVADAWKLPKNIFDETGYTYILDIIDYFSEFIMSYPLVKNDSINTLNSIRQFCMLLGCPKILQTDNGGEYKNHIMKDFCEKK